MSVLKEYWSLLLCKISEKVKDVLTRSTHRRLSIMIRGMFICHATSELDEHLKLEFNPGNPQK